MGASDSELMRALHDEHAACAVGVRSQPDRRRSGARAGRRAGDDVAGVAHARRPEPGPRSVRGWLYTVARRIVIDEWRASRSRPEVVTDVVPEQSSADEAEAIVNRRIVVDALRTLSAEHRAVLIECYFKGASVAEAAATLGIAPGTVKSRTHYASAGAAARAQRARRRVMTDPFEHFDAAYVLGALDDTDRAAFEQHLPGCDECRQRVAELSGLPGLLAGVEHRRRRGGQRGTGARHAASAPRPRGASIAAAPHRALGRRRRRRRLRRSADRGRRHRLRLGLGPTWSPPTLPR